MSKYVVIITIVIVGLAGSGTALALEGSGIQEDPWLIQSLEDFNDFAADANYWAGFTRLETDVNLAGRVYEKAVIAWDWDYAFTGVFDGNYHKITNLTIDDGGVDRTFLGLFGWADFSEIRNLGLEGGSVQGGLNVGSLVGLNGISSISKCYSTCDVSGTWGDSPIVGGLVGQNSLGTILECYSKGDVSGVGRFPYVGGLVGYNDEGSISECYSTGDVSVTGEGGYFNVGGLVGLNYHGNITICFWDIDTQTHGVTEGIGDNWGSANYVLGLPTSQLQQQSNFTDWDFINVWNIGENQTYPYLRTYLAGDINKDGIVNFLDLSITANKWLQEQ